MSTHATDTSVRHSIVVDAPIERAFSTFTDGLLVTSTRPSRSTISPRGARTVILRTWFCLASASYLSPESTWRY